MLKFWAFEIKHNLLGNSEKVFNVFLKKIAKLHYFSIFFKGINKACVRFLRVWTKTQSVGKFWEKFQKFSWENHCVKFLRMWKKNANYREILRKLSNVFWKLLKMHYFSIFFKNLTNNMFAFRAFGRKTQIPENFENHQWKSIE